MKDKTRIEHVISKHGNVIFEDTKLSFPYQGPKLPIVASINEYNSHLHNTLPRDPT
jgi:hypothetical protein